MKEPSEKDIYQYLENEKVHHELVAQHQATITLIQEEIEELRRKQAEVKTSFCELFSPYKKGERIVVWATTNIGTTFNPTWSRKREEREISHVFLRITNGQCRFTYRANRIKKDGTTSTISFQNREIFDEEIIIKRANE